MARQRFIWPSLWEDPDLGRVTPLAQLLYIGCFSNADDDGRLIGDAAFLKAQVFRYRSISLQQIEKLRGELDGACSNFVVYEVDGVTYITFTNWDEWQKPKYRKPSKFPPPPGWRKRRKRARHSQKASGNGSGNDSAKSAEPSPIGQGRVGQGSTTPSSSTSDVDVVAAENGFKLSDERWFHVERIVSTTKGCDAESRAVVEHFAKQLPLHRLADIAQRSSGQTIQWAVGAMKSEAKELAA